MDPDGRTLFNLFLSGGNAVFPFFSMSSNVILNSCILILLIIIYLLFSCGIAAVRFYREPKNGISGGENFSSAIQKIFDSADLYIVAFNLGQALCGVFSFALFFDGVLPLFYNVLPINGISHIMVSLINIFILCVLAILISIFTRIIPSKVVGLNPEKTMNRLGIPIFVLSYLLIPISKLIHPLLGKDTKESSDRIDEQYPRSGNGSQRMSVDGGIHNEMINRMEKFDEATAEEMMTHRTDIMAISLESSVQDVVRLSIEQGYSRIPVYEDDMDNIIGVIYMKDLLKYIDKESASCIPVSDCMRSALYVPENNSAKEIFKELTDKKVQMAIVVDEYGGTSGIVTMEDLLEGIVGNIQDEYDNEIEEIEQLNDTTFLLEGTAEIDNVSHRMGVKLPDNDYYDTIAGLITDILGRIPDEEERPSVVVCGVKFTVLDVSDRRVSRVRAEVLEEHNSN